MSSVIPWELPSFGGRSSRRRSLADRIVRRSDEFISFTEDDLRREARQLEWQAKSGTPLARLLPEAFALCREAARRRLGMSHFPVQIVGGIALFEGCIAEMQTGEGKTLTATLPTFLRSIVGKGCHVVTTNDYLAKRDAELLKPVYGLLGRSVGCIITEMEEGERRAAYACDITYGTAKELGFDFLRDRLRKGPAGTPEAIDDAAENPPVQRGHHFVLVDEADSVLIDDAVTPLIIALPQSNQQAQVSLHEWSRDAAPKLADKDDYEYESDNRSARLTVQGCRKLLLMKKPNWLHQFDAETIYLHVELALVALRGFRRDVDYIIHDEEIVIVDESTGRMMEGRKWQQGLHQAVEARERMPITPPNREAAQVTVQTYFRQYRYLAGMTGTAAAARKEFRHVFGRRVEVIPTNKPCIRRVLPPRIFATMAAKLRAVVVEVQQVLAAGRAVLVGTPSVRESELVSEALSRATIEHEVLNARRPEREAEIIATAGHAGRVTIATNMAGRGTDILLDDAVRRAGGLHVIGTSLHTTVRIDRQLIGRAGRQGDPGSGRFYLSLEDVLLQHLGEKAVRGLQRIALRRPDAELGRGRLRTFRTAQRVAERRERTQRKRLLKQEQQRHKQFRDMRLDPFLEFPDR